MSQHSIFGRTAQLTRADIDAFLDQTDEPHRLLDRMEHDYTAAIADAEDTIARVVAELRVIEEDAREAQAAAARWGADAQTASRRADELRGRGATGGAEVFDGLARIALGREIDGERTARLLASTIADESALAERLREGLSQMADRLDEVRKRRATLPETPPDATCWRPWHAVDILDPAGELGRFEEHLRREEERLADGQPPPEGEQGEQFRLDIAPPAEVEARLSLLKAGR